MTRTAGMLGLAVAALMVSVSSAAENSDDGTTGAWIQLAVDPARAIAVAWADGGDDGKEISFPGTESGAFVLTNRSDVEQQVSDLTLSLGDPSHYEMVTLTATAGRTTHMTSVMHPTGTDVLPFDSRFTLGGGESVSVTVDATPAGN